MPPRPTHNQCPDYTQGDDHMGGNLDPWRVAPTEDDRDWSTYDPRKGAGLMNGDPEQRAADYARAIARLGLIFPSRPNLDQ